MLAPTMNARTFAITIALALLTLPMAPVLADDDQARIRELVRSGRVVPLEQVIADALRRVPGEVVDVEFDEDDDEYEIEVLDADGVVWELEYRASSGAFRALDRDD